MIGVIFSKAGERLEIRVSDSSVYFRNSPRDTWADISGLSLKKKNVIEEFPDLKGDVDWKQKAIERFKDKIKSLPSETARIKYLTTDLESHGYIAEFMQREGHRPIKLKHGSR